MGCGMGSQNQVDENLKDVNVVAESDLADVMLTVADPDEAVIFFQRTMRENPDDIQYMRGLGLSLTRAQRTQEAVAIWAKTIKHPDATDADKLKYAESLIRNSDWDRSRTVLDEIPPTVETYDRYRLEAMVADSRKEWKRSDAFYEVAVGLTTKPAGALNNWGYSKLTRGDFIGAERLFMQSLKQDSTRFTVKNNLVLARAAQGKYTLPVINLTQIERAELLNTMGLSAVKKGDIQTAKSLFREAVETHPQYFESAHRSLEALENS
jgi:Flp pilus assembly protein TadD